MIAGSPEKIKLAIIASHPIQYFSPWYRALSSRLQIHVFYAHRASPEDQAAAGFKIPFEWNIPLLEGYPFTWLGNHARIAGIDRFWGCNTPGVREEIQQGGFDAVLVNGWNLLSYWQAVRAARSWGLPVLVRGDSHLLTPRGLWKRAGKRVIYPFLSKIFDAFLSVGQRNTEYLRSYGVHPEKIFLFPHCVDNDFFRKGAEIARHIPGDPRGFFGIPEGRVVFLFAGKWISRKRPFDFLLALDELRRSGDNIWGLLVGDGPMRPLLEKHIRKHGTPCSLGGFLNQREISRAYAAADALVLPSDGSETWGLVVNEAMACGVPAIVSDRVGCAPDLVLEGKTGFTYPCGRVEELARRMAQIARDPDLHRNLSNGAAEHIRSFSFAAGCRGLEEALGFVLPREQGR